VTVPGFQPNKSVMLVIQTFIHTMIALIARTKQTIFPLTQVIYIHLAAQAHQYSIRKILKYLHPFYIKDKKHIKKIKSFKQTHK